MAIETLTRPSSGNAPPEHPAAVAGLSARRGGADPQERGRALCTSSAPQRERGSRELGAAGTSRRFELLWCRQRGLPGLTPPIPTCGLTLHPQPHGDTHTNHRPHGAAQMGTGRCKTRQQVLRALRTAISPCAPESTLFLPPPQKVPLAATTATNHRADPALMPSCPAWS